MGAGVCRPTVAVVVDRAQHQLTLEDLQRLPRLLPVLELGLQCQPEGRRWVDQKHVLGQLASLTATTVAVCVAAQPGIGVGDGLVTEPPARRERLPHARVRGRSGPLRLPVGACNALRHVTLGFPTARLSRLGVVLSHPLLHAPRPVIILPPAPRLLEVAGERGGDRGHCGGRGGDLGDLRLAAIAEARPRGGARERVGNSVLLRWSPACTRRRRTRRWRLRGLVRQGKLPRSSGRCHVR
mmetsp:Transcript_47818/g.136158  ORF Transcript_47818/g.136158 Transcript_47818/m.136158 type:complete len:240 (+) Transcript_47818:468-1187(+)